MNEGFACIRCGACCRIKDGIVRVSEAEIRRIAGHLGIAEEEFVRERTELSPDRKSLILPSREDGSCVYLAPDNRCMIHDVKPDKCRTFPFDWTNPDSGEVCPGLKACKSSKTKGDRP